MSYTLVMSEPQNTESVKGVQMSPDGVQEVALTYARPLLSRLIEQAREDGVTSALTVRDRRRVYLVSSDWYDRAKAALDQQT